MNRREAERLTHQENTLLALGFTLSEAASLRRISSTLRGWHERECGDGNGCIERDETDGRAYWRNSYTSKRHRIPDLETGAKRRLKTILVNRNQRAISKTDEPATLQGCLENSFGLSYYIQGDPRGAALYIIRPGDVPEGEDVNAYYSRGICVY